MVLNVQTYCTVHRKMKSLLVLLLLLALVSMAFSSDFHRSQEQRGGKEDGERCQRLPRPMSLDRFRGEVLGEGYTELMCKISFPVDPEELTYNFNSAIFENTTTGVFDQVFVGREFGDTSSGVCSVNGTVKLEPLSSRVALFRPVESIFQASEFQHYFFSSDPDNHLIEVSCNETRASVRGRGRQCCSGAYFIFVNSNTDPPHFFDWKALARDLWREMRISLSDGFTFILTHLACPGAVP